MERDDLEELQYITHVANVPSIAERGIFCHRRAGRVAHHDVSLEEVQDRRKGVRVPNGLLLHDYANLYVTARNPMLYLLLCEGHLDNLCVVSVSPDVLDLPDVVVSDRNAAATLCRFRAAGDGLAEVDGDRVACQYWTHHDPLEEDRRRNAKFTEVLVPQMIKPENVQGVYAGSRAAKDDLLARTDGDLEIALNRYLFFNY